MHVFVRWEGVYPALLTPFTADDQLDLPLFVINLRAQRHATVPDGIATHALPCRLPLIRAKSEHPQAVAQKALANRPIIHAE